MSHSMGLLYGRFKVWPVPASTILMVRQIASELTNRADGISAVPLQTRARNQYVSHLMECARIITLITLNHTLFFSVPSIF